MKKARPSKKRPGKWIQWHTHTPQFCTLYPWGYCRVAIWDGWYNIFHHLWKDTKTLVTWKPEVLHGSFERDYPGGNASSRTCALPGMTGNTPVCEATTHNKLG